MVSLKPVGLAIGILALMVMLLGILHVVSTKKTYYLPEGFTSSNIEYPTDPLTEIKNPLIKIVKKLGHMSTYFANPAVWAEVYRTSQMSLTDLARENIRKTREATT
jgi:hypothetical protein